MFHHSAMDACGTGVALEIIGLVPSRMYLTFNPEEDVKVHLILCNVTPIDTWLKSIEP